MGILTHIGQSVQRSATDNNGRAAGAIACLWPAYREGQGKLVADAAGSGDDVGAIAGGGTAAVTGAVAAVRAGVAAAATGFFFFGATGFLVGGAARAGCSST